MTDINYEKKYRELVKDLTEKQFEGTFYKVGGKKPPAFRSIDEAAPIDFVRKYLGDRLIYDNGNIQILDQEGKVEIIDDRPKSLEEKLSELRQNGMGMFFEGSLKTSTTPGGYTVEDARLGKAPIDAIATGKIEILPNYTAPSPSSD